MWPLLLPLHLAAHTSVRDLVRDIVAAEVDESLLCSRWRREGIELAPQTGGFWQGPAIDGLALGRQERVQTATGRSGPVSPAGSKEHVELGHQSCHQALSQPVKLWPRL